MKDQKTFFLGLGAQKAGTTWLVNYLSHSGRVATNIVKEYHVWDALHIQGHAHMIVSREESGASPINKLRYFLQQSPENYFNYFIYMMEQQARSMTCDITPNYAGLNRTVLQAIADGFLGKGVSTKAIFLMRDPVERCWSAARQKSKIKTGRSSVTQEELLEHASLPGAVMRTRYDVTIGEMEAAFDASAVYIGLYEEMFETENLLKLSEFCGVPPKPGFAKEKINATPAPDALSEETYRQIANRYREVYHFVADRYPRAKELWKGFAYL